MKATRVVLGVFVILAASVVIAYLPNSKNYWFPFTAVGITGWIVYCEKRGWLRGP